MNNYYFEGFKLRHICLNEGLDYNKVRQCAYRGTDLNMVIRRPVLTYDGTLSKEAVYHCHCDDCVFMGHTDGHDLYFCKGSHGREPGTWIIARNGDGEWDQSVCRLGYAYKNILIIAQKVYRGLDNG